MQRMSFSARLLCWIVIVGVIPLATVGFYTRSVFFNAIRNAEKSYLLSSLHARSLHLQDWLHGVERDLVLICNSNCVRGTCGKEHADSGGKICPFLSAVKRSHPHYLYIAAHNGKGSVISSVGERPDCWSRGTEEQVGTLSREAAGFVVAPLFWREGNNTLIAVGRAAFRRGRAENSVALAALNLSAAVNEAAGFVVEPRRGEKFLIADSRGRYVLPPEGFDSLPEGIDPIYQGKGDPDRWRDGVAEYADFRGVSVLGAARPVDGTDWLLVAEIDQEAAFSWADLFSLRAGAAVFASLFLVMAVSFAMASRLSRPVRRLADAAKDISSGGWQKLPPFREREAAQVGRAFNTMLDSLEEKQEALSRASALAALGELSSSTVHEMRGPLSSIKLNLQGLQPHCNAAAPDRAMVDMALEQVSRLEDFLADLLNLGKPLQLNKEPCTFALLMDGVMKTVSWEKEKLSVKIDRTGESGGLEVRVDRELMVQALTNLVQNAMEWSEPNGTVSVAAAPHPDRSGWARIIVVDDGPGIAKGEEEKVFQPFYSSRDGGTGLGLAHTKKIVEYHSGSVSAESRPEGGALFTLDLPGSG